MQLYKYMSHEAFLSNLKLRLTPPEDLNDPRECVPAVHIRDPRGYADALVQRNFEQAYLQLLIDSPDISWDELLRRCMAASNQTKRAIGNDSDSIDKGVHDKFMKIINRKIAVLCLTETPDNELMWAHYANSNQGYVVGFNCENEFFKPKKGEPKTCGELMPVQYTDTRPELFVEAGNLDIPKELFFTKTLKWSYEREWRLLRLQSSANEISSGRFHLFKVPQEVLMNVIFGLKFPETKKLEVEHAVRAIVPRVTFQNASFNHKGQFTIS